VANADISIHAGVPARLLDWNGIRIREDALYSDAKGREQSKLYKRAAAALTDLGDPLRRVLGPTEIIFYVAQTQVMPGAFAQFFGGGWHRYSLPQTLLFFTDRRIIAFRLRKTMSGWVWDRGLRELLWGDLLAASPGGFLARCLFLKFRNGDRQTYWRFRWGDLKKVKLLIQVLQPNGVGASTAGGCMVSLCPTCLAPLVPRNYVCTNCGMRFKDEKALLWRGLAVPGGASLYAGASGLGVFRAVVESLLLLAIFFSLFEARRAPSGSEAASGFLLSAAVEAGVLIADKLTAIAMALPQIRDFIPMA